MSEPATKAARTDPMSAPAPASSFIPVAPDCDFSIYNIPFGVFRPAAGGPARIGSAIGELALDLGALASKGFFDAAYAATLQEVY